MKKAFLAVLVCAASLAVAQPGNTTGKPRPTATAKKPAAASTRTECIVRAGLCVAVPASWQKLGAPYGDLGFVIAEPHDGQAQSDWPELNVAVLDPPEQPDGRTVTLDQMVESITQPGGPAAEMQQRTRLLLNGSDAQIVRILLRDPDTQAESIEEVALIDGDGGLVYSFALRCAPKDFERLDPVFQRTIRNWTATPSPAPKENAASPREAKPESKPGSAAHENLPNAPSATMPKEKKEQ